MFIDPWRPFRFSDYRIRLARESWEIDGCRDLRRQVFCTEQGLFADHDRDEIDARAQPIAAIACMAGMPERVVGTVRIHQAEPGLWFGSRLAVHRDYRSLARLGAALIRLAVGTARGRGCGRFLAHVQAQNVVFFRRLHWRSLAEEEICGRPHHLMEADLGHYPACLTPETGFSSVIRSS